MWRHDARHLIVEESCTYARCWRARRLIVSMFLLSTLGISPGLTDGAHAAAPIVSVPRDQVHPRVAFNSQDDQYLVVWEHDFSATDHDIHGQRVATDGTLVAGAIAVGASGILESKPAVAYNISLNEFLVVWELEFSPTDHDIYAQRVGSNGALIGGQIPVATPTNFDTRPGITYNPSDEEYLVVWERRVGSDEFAQHDIYGQRLSVTGAPQGGAIAIAAGSSDESAPVAAHGSVNNEYLVVWHEKIGGDYDIRGQRIAGNGALAGSAITASGVSYDQLEPRLAFNGNANEFLVVWEDHRGGAARYIYGQRLNADGEQNGGNFAISGDGAKSRLIPDVAYKAAEREYLVAWEFEFSPADHDVYRRRVGSDGTLPDTETVVSGLSSGEGRPAVAADDGQAHLVVWEDGRNSPTLALDVYGDIVRLPKLSGYVYFGILPVSGVTVGLYCSDNSDDLGTFVASTTTTSDGWFGLSASASCNYYNLSETDLPGYSSVSANTPSGIAINANWIQYRYPLEGKTLSGNTFYDTDPLPTAAITGPSPGAVISGSVPVIGTANDGNLGLWVLDYGAGTSPSTFQTIATGGLPVINGILGNWDTGTLPDGTYTLRLRVADQINQTAVATVVVALDTTWPTAYFTSPLEGAVVSGIVQIRGTALDTHLTSWNVQYGLGATPSSWVSVSAGTVPVIDSVLGSWTTSGLSPGDYALRLVANDRASHTTTHVIGVNVAEPTPTFTRTATRTPTPSRTATSTRTATSMPTITATTTPTRTRTPTSSPTLTVPPTATRTNTRTGTPSNTPTATATATQSHTPTSTPTRTPTTRPTLTATPTASATPSPSRSATVTLTATVTATPTRTPSATTTRTLTSTTKPTASPTVPPPASATPSPTSSPTPPPAITPSGSPTVTPPTPPPSTACPFPLGVWINFDSRIPGFPSNVSISASAIDGQERVWIGTTGGGIAVHDGVEWTRYTVASTSGGLLSDHVRSLGADGAEVWVGSTSGVSRFDTATNTWTKYTTANSGLPNNVVSAIAFADVGTAPNVTRAQFIATNGGLAQHYTSGGSDLWSVVTTANSPLLDNKVRDVTVDASGAFWIVTAGGVNKVVKTVWTAYGDGNTPGCGVIQSATLVAVDDDGGRIWFGTDRTDQIDPEPGLGVCMLDTASGTWRRFQSSNSGLVDDTVKGLAVDREGRIWIGTDPFYPSSFGGASVCTWVGNSCYWASYGASSGLGTRRVTAVTAGGDRVWFGTSDAGLHSLAPNWGSVLPDDVLSVATQSGHAWIGKTGGLAHFNGTSWTSGLSSPPVRAILPLSADDVWVGTDGDGIRRWTGSAWATMNTSNSGLTDNSVLALAADSKGRIWIGTNSHGLAIFTPRKGWAAFNTTNSPLASDHVTALAADGLGRVWVGTDNGLVMYDGFQWMSFDTADGVPSADIRSLAAKAENVWVATAAGVVRSSGVGWIAQDPPVSVGELRSVRFDPLGRLLLAGDAGAAVHDGSSWTTYRARNSGLTNDGAEAVAGDAAGCIWFGTVERAVQGSTLRGGLLVRGNSAAPLGMPVPSISGFSPTTGPVGAVVTITGSDFDPRDKVYNAVEFRASGFDNWAKAMVVSATATSITAKVPAAAVRGPIRVRTAGGTAASSGDFDPVPSISKLGVAKGVPGIPVDIFGANFDSPSGTVDVRFGNSGWITSVTPLGYDHIQVYVPPDATTGPVQVRNSGGTATSPGPFSVVTAGGLVIFGWDVTQGLSCFQCVAGKSTAVRVFAGSNSATSPAYVSGAVLRVWRAGVPLFTVNAGLQDGGVPNQGWFGNTKKQFTRDGSIDFFIPGSKLPASPSIHTFEVEVYAGPVLLFDQHFGNAYEFIETYPVRIHASAPGPAPAGQQLTYLARNLAAVDRTFPVRDGYAQQIGGTTTGVQVAIDSYDECDGTQMAHCKGTGYLWDFWQQNTAGQRRMFVRHDGKAANSTNDGKKLTLNVGTVKKGDGGAFQLLARLRPNSAFPVGNTSVPASVSIDSPDQPGSPDSYDTQAIFVTRPGPPPSGGTSLAPTESQGNGFVAPEQLPGGGGAGVPSLQVELGGLRRVPLSAADPEPGFLSPNDVIQLDFDYRNTGSADAKDTAIVFDYDQQHMVLYGSGGFVRGTGGTIETELIPGLFWSGTGFADRGYDWPLDEDYDGAIDADDLAQFVMEFDHWDPATGDITVSTDLSKLAPGDVIRNFKDDNHNGRADGGESLASYVKRADNLPQVLFTTPTDFAADYNKTHPTQQAQVSALWFWSRGRIFRWPGDPWDVNYILGPGQGNATRQFWADVPTNDAVVHELGHVFGQVKQYSPHATPAGHSTNKLVPLPYAYDIVGKRVVTGQHLFSAMWWLVQDPVEEAFFEPFEYFDIFNDLRDLAKAASSAPSSGAAAGSSTAFYVSGVVRPDDTVLVSTSYLAENLSPTPADDGSAYGLRFVAGDQLLSEHRFPLIFVEPVQDRDEPLQTTAGSFSIVQPFPAGATAVEIWHDTNMLARLGVSDTTPWVHLLAPNGGESLDGSGDLLVTWDAGDDDGESPTYAVRYSADGGATWRTLVAGAVAKQLHAPLSMLPGGADALVEVEVSDGFHTATDRSDAPFRVGTKAPLWAEIVAPASGARLVQSAPVTLAGSSFDPEDGMLPDEALTWTSSQDGPLGRGHSVTTLLSAGQHVVTVTATDSDGQSASGSVTIELLGDFDDDGLADEYEQSHAGLEWWNRDDAGEDPDGDGLTSRAEAALGTDPFNPDGDGDGVGDGDEVAGGSLPDDPTSAPLPPELLVNRTALDFTVQTGDPSPSPVDLMVISSTPAELSWTATVDVPGVRVTPGSGTTPAITKVTIDAAALAPGRYEGQLTFLGGTSPRSILVSLTVAGPTPTPTVLPTATAMASRTATPTPTPTATATATSTLAVPHGDVNCDGRVSAADITALLLLLPAADPGPCGEGDVNRDLLVDQRDVRALVDQMFRASDQFFPGTSSRRASR